MWDNDIYLIFQSFNLTVLKINKLIVIKDSAAAFVYLILYQLSFYDECYYVI